MSQDLLNCLKCGQPHSIDEKLGQEYAGTSIDCRKCKSENGVHVPLQEQPITELSLAREPILERCWEQWLRFWSWLRSDPKKGWAALFLVLMLLRGTGATYLRFADQALPKVMEWLSQVTWLSSLVAVRWMTCQTNFGKNNIEVYKDTPNTFFRAILE